MEETGYASDTFIEVGCASPNPAIYTSRIYSFLATDVKQVAIDAESVVTLIPLEDVIAMAKSGNLIHSLNISTLFFVLSYLHRIS